MDNRTDNLVFVIIEFIFATLLALAAFLFNTTSNRRFDNSDSIDNDVEDGYSMEEDNIVLGKFSLFRFIMGEERQISIYFYRIFLI